MQIFWHQGGLQIQPESEADRAALVCFASCMRTNDSMPPGMTSMSSGESKLGDEILMEFARSTKKVLPRSLAGKARNKQSVVVIQRGH